MRKIKLYIASSIDGYIAHLDGDLDWLTEFPNPDNNDYGYNDFNQSIDTVIMGGKTYRDILNMDVLWAYKNKETYVITRNKGYQTFGENIQFLSVNIIEKIIQLKEQQGRDIWLVGGGQMISMFLENKLIDEMIITYIPTLLGSGIPLFPKINTSSNWTLLENLTYNNGVRTAHFQIIK